MLFDRHHWWDLEDPLRLLPFCEDPDAVIERAGGAYIPDQTTLQAEFLRSVGEMPEADHEPRDWAKEFQALLEHVYLPPHVVAEMTLAELAAVSRPRREQDELMSLAGGYTRLSEAQKKRMALCRIATLMG